MAGDRAAAARHVELYRGANGSGLVLPNPASAAVAAGETIDIPGPLRSFARMAALSPELKPEDLLGAIARNVVTNGYQAGNANEGLDQTEYLKLVVRYLSQARELERLSGESKSIRIELPVNPPKPATCCESSATGCAADAVPTWCWKP